MNTEVICSAASAHMQRTYSLDDEVMKLIFIQYARDELKLQPDAGKKIARRYQMDIIDEDERRRFLFWYFITKIPGISEFITAYVFS